MHADAVPNRYGDCRQPVSLTGRVDTGTARCVHARTVMAETPFRLPLSAWDLERRHAANRTTRR